nr:hypothetical protein [Eubacterium sp.]
DSCGGFREINDYGLPFGTHRFVYAAYSFWKPIIEAYQYNLPVVEEVDTLDVLERDRETRLMLYMSQWLGDLTVEERNQILHEIGLCNDRIYRVWGAGKNGKKCVDFLRTIGIGVDCILDNGASNLQTYTDLPVIYPEKKIVSESDNIIVAVWNKYDEIKKQINMTTDYDENNIQNFFDILSRIKMYAQENMPQIEGITKPFTITVKGGVCGKTIEYPNVTYSGCF